ncbi:MAG: proton-conducting transporter membrane subunit [Planctomycetota bacterium]
MVFDVLIALSCVSMVASGLLALRQNDQKRLLAYSSIGQMGYILLGIGVGTPLAVLGGIFHLMNHAVMKSLMFLTSGAVEYATGTRDLDKMGGLRKRMPVTAWASLVGSLSISGVPPFCGFWSKLVIIVACVQAGRYGCAAAAVVGSLLTLSSFMKVQKYAFFGDLRPEHENVREVPATMRWAMILLAALCIVMGGLLVPQIRGVVLDPAVDVIRNGTAYGAAVFARGQ